jgi:hypothetical protein
VADMKFLSLSGFRPPPGAMAYRHRIWTAALGLVVMGGLSLALLYIAWRGGLRFNNRGDGIPPFIGWFAGGVLALLTRVMPYVFLKKRLKPGNWLVLRSADGLFVKYRSYLNAHFPEDDEQIVFLPYSAISAARLHRRRWLTPSAKGGTQHKSATFVEIQLNDPQQAAVIAAKLAAERGNKGPRRKTWYGSATPGRYQDFPVQIATDGSLAITWNAEHVDVADAARTDDNWRDASSPEAEAAAVSTLGRMGDGFAVIRLLRRKFGFSLSDAKAQNEEIRRRP